MNNVEDTKCSYGYITLCDKCLEKIKGFRQGLRFGINPDKPVKAPEYHECEWCGIPNNQD